MRAARTGGSAPARSVAVGARHGAEARFELFELPGFLEVEKEKSEDQKSDQNAEDLAVAVRGAHGRTPFVVGSRELRIKSSFAGVPGNSGQIHDNPKKS